MREGVTTVATRGQFVSKLTGERVGGHKEVLYRLWSPLFSTIKRPLCWFFFFFTLKGGTGKIGKEGDQSDHARRPRKILGKTREIKRKVELVENYSEGFAPLSVPGD